MQKIDTFHRRSILRGDTCSRDGLLQCVSKHLLCGAGSRLSAVQLLREDRHTHTRTFTPNIPSTSRNPLPVFLLCTELGQANCNEINDLSLLGWASGEIGVRERLLRPLALLFLSLPVSFDCRDPLLQVRYGSMSAATNAYIGRSSPQACSQAIPLQLAGYYSMPLRLWIWGKGGVSLKTIVLAMHWPTSYPADACSTWTMKSSNSSDEKFALSFSRFISVRMESPHMLRISGGVDSGNMATYRERGKVNSHLLRQLFPWIAVTACIW